MTGNYERAQMCSLAVLGNMGRCGGRTVSSVTIRYSERIWTFTRIRIERLRYFVRIRELIDDLNTDTRCILFLGFTYISLINIVHIAKVENTPINQHATITKRNLVRQGKKTSDPSFSALYPFLDGYMTSPFYIDQGHNQGS